MKKKEKKKGKRKTRELSSYRRRIELRFLSNSEDRTNLKGPRQPEMNINDRLPALRFHKDDWTRIQRNF